MGAGHDLQSASAHPRLEGQLQVLASPNIEPRVVGTEPFEELPVNGKESAGHGRAVDRLGGVATAGLLAGGDTVPVEDEVPVEPAHRQVGRLLILQRFIRDNVNNGTYNVCLVPAIELISEEVHFAV